MGLGGNATRDPFLPRRGSRKPPTTPPRQRPVLDRGPVPHQLQRERGHRVRSGDRHVDRPGGHAVLRAGPGDAGRAHGVRRPGELAAPRWPSPVRTRPRPRRAWRSAPAGRPAGPSSATSRRTPRRRRTSRTSRGPPSAAPPAGRRSATRRWRSSPRAPAEGRAPRPRTEPCGDARARRLAVLLVALDHDDVRSSRRGGRRRCRRWSWSPRPRRSRRSRCRSRRCWPCLRRSPPVPRPWRRSACSWVYWWLAGPSSPLPATATPPATTAAAARPRSCAHDHTLPHHRAPLVAARAPPCRTGAEATLNTPPTVVQRGFSAAFSAGVPRWPHADPGRRGRQAPRRCAQARPRGRGVRRGRRARRARGRVAGAPRTPTTRSSSTSCSPSSAGDELCAGAARPGTGHRS